MAADALSVAVFLNAYLAVRRRRVFLGEPWLRLWSQDLDRVRLTLFCGPLGDIYYYYYISYYYYYYYCSTTTLYFYSLLLLLPARGEAGVINIAFLRVFV